jgi:homoserine/homoserine lactone efflux protein
MGVPAEGGHRQAIPAEFVSGLIDEGLEQIVFHGGEANGAAIGIDQRTPGPQELPRSGRRTSAQRRSGACQPGIGLIGKQSPRRCSDASKDLAPVGGFRDEVVRAELERNDLLGFLLSAGEHENRCAGNTQWPLYIGFITATIVLMLIPGPNVSLIVANSIAYGTRYGLLTLAGTSAAMAVQLGLTVLGLTALLGVMATWFEWLRWLGVAYLLWLGIRQWCASPQDLTRTPPQPRSVRAIALRGFLISLTNPKTLLFFGAFFPQFIAPGSPIGPQLALLCGSFLLVAVTLDSGWALAAGRARGVLATRGKLRNRLSGGLLIGVGVGLALAHRR